MVPGYQFMPAYKSKIWDGKIRLFNKYSEQLYAGLVEHTIRFANDRSYSVDAPTIDKNITNDIAVRKFIDDHLSPHSHGKRIYAHDHQVDAVRHAINRERTLLLSPTASGKSLIIYSLVRYYLEHSNLPKDKKILIIVPTTSLVSQLCSDFFEYSEKDQSFDSTKMCHEVFAGKDKTSKTARVIVSTWQSIYKMNEQYFSQFGAVIGDECLHPDSMISLPGGKERKISDLKVGDVVNTYNEKTGVVEEKPILKIHENISITEDMYELHLENGRSVKITGNHKVLLSNGCWKRVDELKEGDIINSIE